MSEKTAKMRHCWVCGKETGIIEDRFHDKLDTCGGHDCERELRNTLNEERMEAHERLDRDLGWL